MTNPTDTEAPTTDDVSLTPEQQVIVDNFANLTANLAAMQERTVELGKRRADAAMQAKTLDVPSPVLASAAGISVQAVYKVIQAARKAAR